MTIADTLIDLGISTPDSIRDFRDRVRDRDDVAVRICSRSGVIFLANTQHIGEKYYQDQDAFSYWSRTSRSEVLRENQRDDERRAALLRPLAKGRRWLDVGTGAGGILDLVAGDCAKACAVEPQRAVRQSLNDLGYEVRADIEDMSGQAFDVITLFHVYEHLTNPIVFLSALRRHLAPGGKLLIEVPHARDFLISFLECQSFISFTLWSEHAILHTRDSLRRFVEASGFSRCDITGIQRYPLANHLHWLSKGQPGGHVVWPQLSAPALDEHYAEMLSRLDMTDTLLATVEI